MGSSSSSSSSTRQPRKPDGLGSLRQFHDWRVTDKRTYYNDLNSGGAWTGYVFGAIFTLGISTACVSQPHHWFYVFEIERRVAQHGQQRLETKYVAVGFNVGDNIEVFIRNSKQEAIKNGISTMDGRPASAYQFNHATMNCTVKHLHDVLYTKRNKTYGPFKYNCQHFVREVDQLLQRVIGKGSSSKAPKPAAQRPPPHVHADAAKPHPFQRYLEKAGVPGKVSDYYNICIIGAQNSGKTTLRYGLTTAFHLIESGGWALPSHAAQKQGSTVGTSDQERAAQLFDPLLKEWKAHIKKAKREGGRDAVTNDDDRRDPTPYKVSDTVIVWDTRGWDCIASSAEKVIRDYGLRSMSSVVVLTLNQNKATRELVHSLKAASVHFLLALTKIDNALKDDQLDDDDVVLTRQELNEEVSAMLEKANRSIFELQLQDGEQLSDKLMAVNLKGTMTCVPEKVTSANVGSLAFGTPRLLIGILKQLFETHPREASKAVVSNLTSAMRALHFPTDAGELLGSAFSSTLYSQCVKVYPPEGPKPELSSLQRKLVRKLGDNAYPFSFKLPSGSPSSISLENVSEDVQHKSCSVDWELVVFAAHEAEVKDADWADYVRLEIRKLNYAPPQSTVTHRPHQEATKKFALSAGEVKVVAELDNEVYDHGKPITVSLFVDNKSKRSVKSIEIRVRQFATVRTPKGDAISHKAIISELASSEGCPVGSGGKLDRKYIIVPSKASVGSKQNVALDGKGRDNADTCLASSNKVAEGGAEPQVGILISYDVKIKVFFSGINAMASVKLPFLLSTPAPDLTKLSVNLDQQGKPGEHEASPPPLPPMTPEELDNGDGLELVFEEFLQLRAQKFFGDGAPAPA
ncbi:hypothetical protein PTSG_07382 [Salpingoeca rosetta]|uniref:Arrestin C-terminal-like domain-containing protein n=1 Tax=Salpingoeca rosetta (strain ATCC 50818 / BSB-021) TaxID=946362 RepID=F2UIJ2_SALR5|nr:uncharacterized protein PTSG_07382 [Salpingoeca rosetta]EGD77041.1 hypothetical protein PTSG_07382 [Salpingoeca rosetta]|eukprot:XP_004990881.1 hypothetical protein PTSG_07382 [Salpingoeca rosetta]